MRKIMTMLAAGIMLVLMLPSAALAAENTSSLSADTLALTASDDEDWVEINETNFPDDNFRQYLLDWKQEGFSNTPFVVPSKITNLSLNNLGISSLEGIEYFTSLEELLCSGNNLSSLDLSKNTALTYLRCGGNNLSSLDLSKNTALTCLSCSENNLSSLDLSNNTALTELECGENNLTELNVSNNAALTTLYCDGNELTSLDLSSNTALDSLYCNDNNLSSLDLSSNGALRDLTCVNNNLSSLDLSNNTALQSLFCDNNKLGSLDVGKNTALTQLSCGANGISSLDVSKNTKLEYLICHENNLTKLNVSKNKDLVAINCAGNKLTTLDVSQNEALGSLWCINNKMGKLYIGDSEFYESGYSGFYRFGYDDNVTVICGAPVSTVKLSATAYNYNGKVRKPAVTVKDAYGKTIPKDVYKVTYAKGRKNVGKYKVTVEFTEKGYSGKKTLYFTIYPKATSISKVTANSKGFTVTWKKQSAQTTGYQVQYARNGSFTAGNKTVTIGKNTTVSKTVNKLKAKKKYYVRVRTIMKVGKLTYNSPWSSAKTVTTKK